MRNRMFVILLLALLVANVSACRIYESEGNTDTTVVEMSDRLYNEALSLLDSSDVYGAYDIFLTISDYKDVSDYLSRFIFHLEKSEEAGYTFVYKYDDSGRRISTELFYGENEKTFTNYIYDENGFLIQVDYYTGSLSETTIYKYDENGNPISQQSTHGNDDVFLEYDDNGNIIKVNNTFYILERKFDACGNLIESIRLETSDYKNDLQLLDKTVYEYNEHGDLIISVTYEHGGPVFTTINQRFEYDENGNKIKCIKMKSDGTEYIDTEWEYDVKGNLVKDRSCGTFDNEEYITWYYKYDETGNKIEAQRETDKNGITTRYYYEYDKYGNLLKMTCVDLSSLTENEVFSYTYKLYYKPALASDGKDPVQNLPNEMVGYG